MRRIPKLIVRHPVISLLFVAAVTFSVMFAVRTLDQTRHWDDYRGKRGRIEPWMTPGMIAHVWHLDRGDVIFIAGASDLSIPDRASIEEIAQERGVPVEDIIKNIEDFVRREGHR